MPNPVKRGRPTVEDVLQVGRSTVGDVLQIGRNTVDYGGGGTLRIEVLRDRQRLGVRLTFTDQGPGIPDLARAMTDGYSTGNGLGLGMSGAKRLSNEFEVKSTPGQGTTVILARWK